MEKLNASSGGRTPAPKGSDAARLESRRLLDTRRAAWTQHALATFCGIFALLWSLTAWAEAPEQPAPPREFYTLPSGTVVPFEEAWRRQGARTLEPEAHWGRAVIEEFAVLAVGSAWYWASRDLNEPDWDLPADFESIARRLWTPSYIRFDTNAFFVNQGHFLAGALYYGIARANDIHPIPSLLYAVLTSAAWEGLIEVREFISLNDIVISPYGGQAVGEVFHKYGELFSIMGDDLPFAARALTALFAGPRLFHELIGDPPIEPWDPAYGPPMQHDFRVLAGSRVRSGAAGLADGAGTLALHTEVVDMPGWHMPGRMDKLFGDGNFTTLDLTIDVDSSGVDRATLAARATLAGYYNQNIDEVGDGYAFTMGISRGAWLDLHEHTQLDDRIAMVDIAGPTFGIEGFAGPARAAATVSAHFDLGSITPVAFRSFASENSLDGIRSELVREGYYFAYGGNVIPKLALELGPVEAAFEFEYGRFRAYEGPDRVYRNEVPRPVELVDNRTVVRAWLALTLPRGLQPRIEYGRTDRWGRADSFSQNERVDEFALTLGYRF